MTMDEQYDAKNMYDSPPSTSEALVGRSGGISLGHRRNPNVRAIVMSQIAELRKEIEVREAVIKNLDANPGIEATLDSLRKIGV